MLRKVVRRFAVFLAALAAGFAWQCSAHAQFAGLTTEYDWTLSAGDHRFGVYQSLHYPEGWRRTEIHWGGGAIGVERSRRTIAMAAGGTLATLLLIGTFSLAWSRRRNSSASAS